MANFGSGCMSNSLWAANNMRGQPVARFALIIYMLLLHMWLAFTLGTVSPFCILSSFTCLTITRVHISIRVQHWTSSVCDLVHVP